MRVNERPRLEAYPSRSAETSDIRRLPLPTGPTMSDNAPTMHELLALSLIDLRDRLVRKKASPVELMHAVLDRIAERNQALNAIVAMRDPERLRADAHAAEQRIMRGEGRPLEGIPFGVKDLEGAEGLVTSEGSVLFRDRVAERDDVHVGRLRAAGAILLGKTNAPEFGPTAITKNVLYGVTRNPWDPTRTPGGSSGGSAAALASGMLPLVTASDGGGSIRIPAAWTGAFGLKPSHGRVPRGPQQTWDTSQMAVYGPLTKTVEDAALVLDVLAGPSLLDPTALPHPGLSYLEHVGGAAPERLRIGFSADLGRAVVQSDVARLVAEGLRVLERLGHTIVDVKDGPPPLGEDWMSLVGWGLAARLRDELPGNEDKIARYLRRIIEAANEMTPARWGRINEQRASVVAWCARTFEHVDVLVTPTVPYDPPPARGPFPDETEGRVHEPNAAAIFTMPFNVAWNPAASVRVGLSDAGLPAAMQIAGPCHRDDVVLSLARAFERERPWHPRWPN